MVHEIREGILRYAGRVVPWKGQGFWLAGQKLDFWNGFASAVTMTSHEPISTSHFTPPCLCYAPVLNCSITSPYYRNLWPLIFLLSALTDIPMPPRGSHIQRYTGLFPVAVVLALVAYTYFAYVVRLCSMPIFLQMCLVRWSTFYCISRLLHDRLIHTRHSPTHPDRCNRAGHCLSRRLSCHPRHVPPVLRDGARSQARECW